MCWNPTEESPGRIRIHHDWSKRKNLDTPCQCGIYNEVKVVQGCVSNTTMKYGFSVIDIYRKQATSVFKRVDFINAC